MLLGGAKRIGSAAERLVPFAAVGYMLLCIFVLLVRWRALPDVLASILRGAVSPRAVTGGVIGSAFTALRIGASRGVFTNEAGTGTAAIAHGASEVDHPVKHGLVGIVEVFLDTIVICTLTALVILCSGVDINYGVDTGVLLTVDAFSEVLGAWVCVPIAVAMCCFAVATVLGWGLYGIRCAQYLFGEKAWRPFVYLQGAVVLISSVLQTGTVWILAETVNGLMAIPNLIALAYLAPELHRLVGAFTPATKNLGIKKQAF
jgi:AGCS family alanine or glycine:cation symporter